MSVQRTCIGFVQRLVTRRLGRRFPSRSSSGVLSLLANHKANGPLLVPVQTSCISLQVRCLSTDGTCEEHGQADCKTCSKEVSLDELTQLVNGTDDVKLFDVRESYELRDAGSIPKAINIPLTQLKSTFLLESDQFKLQLGLPKPTKSDNIVFYGMGCNRSVAALEIACKMGYKKARHYPGGWQEWSKSQEHAQ